MYVGKTLFAQVMDFLPWTTLHRIVAGHTDPGHRFATFFYAAGLAGMSVHVIVSEIHERTSFSLPMNDRDWFKLDKPRKLDRTDLAIRTIVNRLLTFIEKRYGAKE